ncbi:hypothetical protein DSUL_30096 [Desulfovibrionales bacterium]
METGDCHAIINICIELKELVVNGVYDTPLLFGILPIVF